MDRSPQSMQNAGVSGNARYIALLLVFIGSALGYVYAGSEVQTVHVTGKRTEEARGRRGTTTRWIVETDQGELQLLQFPVIGYAFGVEDVYAEISPGSSIRVRVGQWPPGILGSHARPHIMTVY